MFYFLWFVLIAVMGFSVFLYFHAVFTLAYITLLTHSIHTVVAFNFTWNAF